MERLLMLRLKSSGCAAEARLNDIAVARTGAAGGDLSVPVHEYLLEGENHLALVLDAPPPGASAAPRLLDAPIAAVMRLLLPRVGQAGSDTNARSLAELELGVPAGEVFQPPHSGYRSVELPIKFPRWRWLDLPLIEDPAAEQPLVAGFVQALAIALAKGDADAFVQAARIRFEELALAYRQHPADLVARWRSRIQLLSTTKALKMVLPALPEVVLLPCAGGRMVECVSPAGEPILRTEPAADGSRRAWPIRVAVIDGQCHVVR